MDEKLKLTVALLFFGELFRVIAIEFRQCETKELGRRTDYLTT